MKLQCETCRFWTHDTMNEGSCRRHVPAVLVMQSGGTYPATAWPYTHSWDWCGEYEAREDDLNQELYSMASR